MPDMTLSKLAATAFLAMTLIPATTRAQYLAPAYGAQTFITRSDYYRQHPREDPEPFRCNYAADAGCPGRRFSGYIGDPREDPEPLRCTYSSGAECGGVRSGIQ